MGFGGLLTFACRKLRYELCGWLISQYDFTYHRLNMGIDNPVSVTEEHVSKVMGIPSSGADMVILKKTGSSNRTYTLRELAKFVLQYLEDGIREYRQKQPTYIRDCLMFLQSKVEVTIPLAAAWSDDVLKDRLATEISTFGGYGHVHWIIGEFFNPCPNIEHYVEYQPMQRDTGPDSLQLTKMATTKKAWHQPSLANWNGSITSSHSFSGSGP
ncbi:hypothetical protein CK203_041473 [Vitis vinifera]|uniref:Uncharacterized protein n=1 Tax=Vitis vinifera TaxID=29760 RepID=A0A438HNF2_VITVI|nr:hypothetical protein CK203_041473 [Vitis vinifera]